MSKPTGGSAFPIVGTHEQLLEVGMTLRDYFAVHASDSDIAPFKTEYPAERVDSIGSQKFIVRYTAITPNHVARYAFADAMLAERSKQ